jgi:tRNA pseudouridine55 synthase
MDREPLYEHARSRTPLPWKIEIEEWLESDHDIRYPEQLLSGGQKQAPEKTSRSVQEDVRVVGEPEEMAEDSRAPTTFALGIKISGGAYVRSIVHDLGHAVGSAAHVVTLTRSRRGKFTLEPADIGFVSWDAFNTAVEDIGAADERGRAVWERGVLDKFVVDVSATTASNTCPNITRTVPHKIPTSQSRPWRIPGMP